MERRLTKTTVKFAFASAVALFIIGSFLAYSFLNKTAKIENQPISVSVGQTQTHILYQGRNGINALKLLKQSMPVEQNASGLVTAINYKRADDAKREYWAFYINGKLSSVSSQQYITKDTDTLEWKIERY